MQAGPGFFYILCWGIACMAGGGSLPLGGPQGPPQPSYLSSSPFLLCFSEVLDFVLTFLQ